MLRDVPVPPPVERRVLGGDVAGCDAAGVGLGLAAAAAAGTWGGEHAGQDLEFVVGTCVRTVLIAL